MGKSKRGNETFKSDEFFVQVCTATKGINVAAHNEPKECCVNSFFQKLCNVRSGRFRRHDRKTSFSKYAFSIKVTQNTVGTCCTFIFFDYEVFSMLFCLLVFENQVLNKLALKSRL